MVIGLEATELASRSLREISPPRLTQAAR